MSEKHEFLSDGWVAAAKALREEGGDAGAPPHSVKMNLIITEAPFGDGEVNAHLDTTEGMQMDLGHLDDPEVTVTVDYGTAKAIFIDQNPQAGMQAFMAGKIKVAGDMTKLMSMQSGAPDPAAAEMQAKLKEITA